MKKNFFLICAMLTALLFASCEGNTPSGNGESHSQAGMYVGITGFSDNVEFYNGTYRRYNILTKDNSGDFTSFINSLSMGDATVLYYAVDDNLSYLANCSFPEDLSSVNIITFTDGLNQGSRALDKQNGNHDYAANDNSYVAAINEKLKNTKVGGLPITAYAIGIRGKDVQGDAVKTFSDNLTKLSSSAENAMEVSNMEEVNVKFKEIAESLYKKSESTNLTITIPMPSENEKERFTFDNITSATDSKCYLEGVYSNGALTNIKYVGCMSNTGSLVQEQSAGGVKISFNFENFTDENGNSISTAHMQQWHMESGQSTWTRNSEFKPGESIVVKEERKTAVIMLILDCSSSLGSDFAQVKAAANNFIKTLAGEMGNNGTNPDPDPDPTDNNPHCWELTYIYEGVSITGYVWATEEEVKATALSDEISNFSYRRASANDENSCEALNSNPANNTAQVRFCKEQAYERVPAMSIGTEENGEYIEKAGYQFGTDAGTTSYYEIPSGLLYPLIYFVSDDDEYTGWYYALDSPYYYDFAANKKYTFTCGDDGTNLIFSITLDGNANVPAKIVETRRIAKSELIKLNKVRK